MKLRVGVIGLGPHWENRYRPALRALSDRFEVRAVYDQVAHRACQAAQDFGAETVEGYRALVQRADIDAILLFSRQWHGTLPILAACDAGKAVYNAVPLDVGWQEVARLRERVEQAGIAFEVEMTRRHAPATIRLKELIATRLGQPRLLFSHMRRPREKRSKKRGLLPELTSHTNRQDLIELVDWCNFIVGREATSVFGVMHAGSPDDALPYDYEMMTLDFSGEQPLGSGPIAQISCGRYVPSNWEEAVTFRPPTGLQVSCENGIAFLDLPAQLAWFDDAGRHFASLESERPAGELSLLRFYRSVTSLVRQSSADDAYRALEIVLGADESHRTSQRVYLSPRTCKA